VFNTNQGLVCSGMFKAVERVDVAVVIADLDGIIQFVNPAFTTMTGYASQELVGQTHRVLSPGRHSQAFYTQIWERIRAGEAWHDEAINRRKDGSLYTAEIEISPIRSGEGAVDGYIAIIQNVLEHQPIVKSSEAEIGFANLNASIVGGNREEELLSGDGNKPLVGRQRSRAIPDLSPAKVNSLNSTAAHSSAPSQKIFAGIEARILLAEDNSTNQQVALGILGMLGLTADIAENGIEALQALASHAYDLVLMDVQMPQMDGLEATRQIRSSAFPTMNPHIPIIAMTAHCQQSDRLECIEAGMNDYVSKPVYSKVLAEVLSRWMPGPAAETSPTTETPPLLTEGAPPALPLPGLPIVFDRAGMASRLMNDEELIQLVMRDFLDAMPRQIEALRTLAESGDPQGAGGKAHLIKGAAANIGGEALRALAHRIEKAGIAGDLESVAGQVDALQFAFFQLEDAMTEHLTQASS
jgi:PAS domain S-box-containing protein